MSPWTRWAMLAALGASLLGCRERAVTRAATEAHAGGGGHFGPVDGAKVAQYTTVRLTADLAGLSERERRMLPLLIEAASEMDTVYQQQYYPARDSLLASVSGLRHAPLHRDQLRPVGPARRGSAVRPRRRASAPPARSSIRMT